MKMCWSFRLLMFESCLHILYCFLCLRNMLAMQNSNQFRYIYIIFLQFIFDSCFWKFLIKLSVRHKVWAKFWAYNTVSLNGEKNIYIEAAYYASLNTINQYMQMQSYFRFKTLFISVIHFVSLYEMWNRNVWLEIITY